MLSLKDSKTSKPHVLALNFAGKIDLRRGEKRIDLSNIIIYYTWENIKKNHATTKNLNYQLQH